jgi:hypothetical protein
MTFAAGALIFFRIVGALWVIGGVFLARQLLALGKIERALDQIGGDPDQKDDRGRDRWMLAGGALTALAGAAMLVGSWLSIPALCCVIAHQMLYFVRQRRRELAAGSDADAADEARPARSTINAFFFSLVMAVLAAWLGRSHMLW